MLLEQPILEVSSNMKFGNLATQWCFGSEANKVWKCTCSCGCVCYVKETALQQGEVEDCGSSIHKRKIKVTNRVKRKYIISNGVETHICLRCGAEMPYESQKIYCDKCK